MRVKKCLGGIFATLIVFCATPGLLRAQASQDSQTSQGNAFLKDYSKGPKWFGNFTAPYRQQPIPSISLENSPRLKDLIKDGKLHVQAGAGIVADSDPVSEWQETENKARAVLRAAELAEQGLDTRVD